MDNTWLQYGPASNKLKQTYVRGFMDISGNVIIRNGGLKISGGNVIGITKTMVGLGNVDNTSDANKPVSTAQQSALNLKSTIASPTFTGIVTTPDISVTNTTVSTTTTSGALLVAGGVGIGGSVNIGGNTRIIGGLIVDGSLNVTGNIIRTDIQSTIYPCITTNKNITADSGTTCHLECSRSCACRNRCIRNNGCWSSY